MGKPLSAAHKRRISEALKRRKAGRSARINQAVTKGAKAAKYGAAQGEWRASGRRRISGRQRSKST